jgi:hypothetical protein
VDARSTDLPSKPVFQWKDWQDATKRPEVIIEVQTDDDVPGMLVSGGDDPGLTVPPADRRTFDAEGAMRCTGHWRRQDGEYRMRLWERVR